MSKNSVYLTFLVFSGQNEVSDPTTLLLVKSYK